MFGTTETSGIVCTYAVPTDGFLPEDVVPLGRPIDDVVVAVLDEDRERVPIGQSGTLAVSGPTLGSYDSETAGQGFWKSASGRRWYLTGDTVRLRADGVLEFLGRADEQINLHGVRVEPVSVESMLNNHPGVHECAVLAREWFGRPTLVAYIVPVERGGVGPGELRSFAASRLPKRMVPTVFEFLDALPRTRSGKVARQELRERPFGDATCDDDEAESRSSAEEMVAAVWAEALPGQRFGMSSNFLEVGGDSITGLRIRARLREMTGHRIPLAVFNANPTVRSLAGWLDAVDAEPGSRVGGLE
jgi:acyl-coenzyme A synthetase/AMP-(fatty) acid ligase/aryl carrier-like protein